MLVGQWLDEDMPVACEISDPERLTGSLRRYLGGLPALRRDHEGINLEVQQVTDGHEIGKMVGLMLAPPKVPTAAVYGHYASAGIEHGPATGSATKLNRAFEIRESDEGVFGLPYEPQEAALEVVSTDLRYVAGLVEIEDRVLGIGVRHKWLSGCRKRRREPWSEVHKGGGWVTFEEVVSLYDADVGCYQQMCPADGPENDGVVETEMENKAGPEFKFIGGLQFLNHMLCCRDESVTSDVETRPDHFEAFDADLLKNGNDAVAWLYRLTIAPQSYRTRHAAIP